MGTNTCARTDGSASQNEHARKCTSKFFHICANAEVCVCFRICTNAETLAQMRKHVCPSAFAQLCKHYRKCGSTHMLPHLRKCTNGPLQKHVGVNGQLGRPCHICSVALMQTTQQHPTCQCFPRPALIRPSRHKEKKAGMNAHVPSTPS